MLLFDNCSIVMTIILIDEIKVFFSTAPNAMQWVCEQTLAWKAEGKFFLRLAA